MSSAIPVRDASQQQLGHSITICNEEVQEGTDTVFAPISSAECEDENLQGFHAEPVNSKERSKTNNQPDMLMYDPSVEASSVPVPLPACENLKSEGINASSTSKFESQSYEDSSYGSKAMPGVSRTGETKCLEPGCKFRCARIPKLRIHLEEFHGIQQERKLFAFNSEEEFNTWLSAVQSEARCTYMRRRGWQVNKNGSVTACFYCHRGGAYTSKATKKQMKQQGSCKIGVECTSSMKVTMWTDLTSKTDEKRSELGEAKQVHVEAYLQHYGHNLDLNHTRITPAQRDDIAKKLNSGISRNKIMDEIRGTLDAAATPHRLHLISLQDLYNIEKRGGIKNKKKKQGDDEGTTVQAWIEKMQLTEDNPVLLIKYQQEKATEACSCLSDDDFILILQTPLQAKMLRRYGPNQGVCMDFTQGDSTANGPKHDPSFYLISMEVLIPNPDNQDEVFPVAWFVSNRRDRPVIEIFLQQLKNNLSGLTLTPSYLLLPSNVITGGCDWFAVWTFVFGSGPRKLLSSWHIISEWKQRLHRNSVKSAPLEASRFLSNLQTVLHEPSLERFMSHLQDFMKDISSVKKHISNLPCSIEIARLHCHYCRKLSPIELQKEESTIPYVKYWKQNYMERPETWSRAYRTEAHIAAENRFENYSCKILRHIYHEGFKRKQLDVLIKTLMRHSRDKALNKLRQSYKHTSESAIKRKTAATHWDSTKLPLDFVSPHQDLHTWSVMSVIDSVRALEQPSQSGQPVRLKKVAVEYIVTCADIDRCPARLMCSYRCEDCGICSHHFSCTCQNEQKTNAFAGDGMQVLCEHSHLVIRYMRKNGMTVESLFAAPVVAQVEDHIDYNCSKKGSKKIVVMVVGDQENPSTDPAELENQFIAKEPELPSINEESASGRNTTTVVEVEGHQFTEQSTDDDSTEAQPQRDIDNASATYIVDLKELHDFTVKQEASPPRKRSRRTIVKIQNASKRSDLKRMSVISEDVNLTPATNTAFSRRTKRYKLDSKKS